MIKKIIASVSLLLLIIGCSKEEGIPVSVDFEIEVLNNDFTTPVLVHVLNNHTTGAEFYQWTFTGGKPAASTKRNPGTISYGVPGEYIIKLVASNKDESVDSKEITIHVAEAIVLDFDINTIGSSFAPVAIELESKTTGASTYNWTFEGGNPTSSQEQNPTNVIFNSEGIHTVTLEISNGTQSEILTKKIEVLPALTSAFDWEVSDEDNDYQAPIRITTQNNSVSATSYAWSFENGNPTTSTEENPQVVFETSGIHTISLTTTNDKGSVTTEKEIEVFEDTNLKVFDNVKLGINTAHTTNTFGSFFSTQTGLVYTEDEVTEENGSSIDIVFYGLNSRFDFNQFLAPDTVNTTTFASIPNATHTQFINSQELTNVGIQITSPEFDAMQNDGPLQNIPINETTLGQKAFDNTTANRIVLFKTSDGKKGAIKIISYEADGQNSYITVDIKVQKNN